MIKGKALCLNMIVKNERGNIERCLSAVADHIACWVIADTGSTDGTAEFIASFFATRNLPGRLHSFPFRNFEQARNAVLDCAPLRRSASTTCCDADLELVVEDPAFRAGLGAPGYRVRERLSSGIKAVCDCSFAGDRSLRGRLGGHVVAWVGPSRGPASGLEGGLR
jgi:glycosyltransferase involved in cell wall biosynthesis